MGGSREATCVEDQMSTRYLKVSITTRGPGLLHPFTPQSRCHPAPPQMSLFASLGRGVGI